MAGTDWYPKAGWYASPVVPGREDWWDGHRWHIPTAKRRASTGQRVLLGLAYLFAAVGFLLQLNIVGDPVQVLIPRFARYLFG